MLARFTAGEPAYCPGLTRELHSRTKRFTRHARCLGGKMTLPHRARSSKVVCQEVNRSIQSYVQRILNPTNNLSRRP